MNPPFNLNKRDLISRRPMVYCLSARAKCHQSWRPCRGFQPRYASFMRWRYFSINNIVVHDRGVADLFSSFLFDRFRRDHVIHRA